MILQIGTKSPNLVHRSIILSWLKKKGETRLSHHLTGDVSIFLSKHVFLCFCSKTFHVIYRWKEFIKQIPKIVTTLYSKWRHFTVGQFEICHMTNPFYLYLDKITKKKQYSIKVLNDLTTQNSANKKLDLINIVFFVRFIF